MVIQFGSIGFSVYAVSDLAEFTNKKMDQSIEDAMIAAYQKIKTLITS